MSERHDRRAFLGTAGAAGLTLAAPGVAAARSRRERRDTNLVRGGSFQQGVASGDPAPRGITLWTRVDELESRSLLELEVSPDRDFRRVIERRRLKTSPSRGFTTKARVAGRPLQPGETYYYRFYTRDEESPVGRFRTALPRDSRQPVRIGFFSCQDYEAGFYTAHAGLADEDDLDLVVCLGDYIYERSFEDDKAREDNLGANRDGEVQTLPEYRDKYALYHSDRNLRRLRRLHPLVAVFDDHEVEDNWARDEPGEATQDRRVRFLRRRRNGYKAFYENMPIIRDPADFRRIYGNLRLGRNAELLMIDTRQYRDDQPCGDQIGVPCPPEERNDPSRTLLGAEQKRWLKRRLERSPATWKVVANQIMIMALDTPAGNPLNPDQWDGYGAERRELLEFARDRGVQDLTFVTGDIHTFFAGNVTPSGREALVGGEQSVATEFVGGSMTTRGIADGTGGEGLRDITALIGDEGVVKRNNPHIKFSNQSDKGYGILEARRDELRVEYRAPETTRERRSPVRRVASFRVGGGSPEVEVLSGGPVP